MREVKVDDWHRRRLSRSCFFPKMLYIVSQCKQTSTNTGGYRSGLTGWPQAQQACFLGNTSTVLTRARVRISSHSIIFCFLLLWNDGRPLLFTACSRGNVNIRCARIHHYISRFTCNPSVTKMDSPRLSELGATSRRRALIIAIITVVIARSAPYSTVDDALKRWSEARKARREEKRRRDMETPL